jgi:hypothetical protein
VCVCAAAVGPIKFVQKHRGRPRARLPLWGLAGDAAACKEPPVRVRNAIARNATHPGHGAPPDPLHRDTSGRSRHSESIAEMSGTEFGAQVHTQLLSVTRAGGKRRPRGIALDLKWLPALRMQGRRRRRRVFSAAGQVAAARASDDDSEWPARRRHAQHSISAGRPAGRPECFAAAAAFIRPFRRRSIV